MRTSAGRVHVHESHSVNCRFAGWPQDETDAVWQRWHSAPEDRVNHVGCRLSVGSVAPVQHSDEPGGISGYG